MNATHLIEIRVVTKDESWIDTYEWEPEKETLEAAVQQQIAFSHATWNCKATFHRAYVEEAA